MKVVKGNILGSLSLKTSKIASKHINNGFQKSSYDWNIAILDLLWDWLEAIA